MTASASPAATWGAHREMYLNAMVGQFACEAHSRDSWGCSALARQRVHTSPADSEARGLFKAAKPKGVSRPRSDAPEAPSHVPRR